MEKMKAQDASDRNVSRRDFIKIAGTVAVGISGAGCASHGTTASPNFLKPENLAPDAAPAGGYLLVDTQKCQGCVSCMLACSLVHEGVENLSLSRIQVMQNPFERFPEDISVSQCRQCLYPACVDACPEGALHISKKHGNLRLINRQKCTGCKSCIEACPYEPTRILYNHQKEHALKCDMCIDTPFWKESGGVGGKQACIAICPVGAIIFSSEVPVQEGDTGYEVNLRGEVWEEMGYSVD